MKKVNSPIGIVGAGPAGAHLALLLARDGYKVDIYDPTHPREKPCGGGVTIKAIKEIEVLRSLSTKAKSVSELDLISPWGRRITVPSKEPILIFSRKEFDLEILEKAKAAGARHIPERVQEVSKKGDAFEVRTRSGRVKYNLLVGADGVTSCVRRALKGRIDRSRILITLGYRAAGALCEKPVLKFYTDLKGYLWSFPGINETSIGIGTYSGAKPVEDLRRRLKEFIASEYGNLNIKNMKSYSYFLPSFRNHDWMADSVSGPGWALIGEAAGFNDPVTGEGIYYALKSAQTLHRAIAEGSLEKYDDYWKAAFGMDLQLASIWATKFVNVPAMFGIFTMARFHAETRVLIGDLFSGWQRYSTLHERILTGTRSPIWRIINRPQKRDRS